MIRVSREWKNPQVFSLAQGTGFNRDRSEEAQDPSWPLQPSKSRQTKAPRAMRAHRALLIEGFLRRSPSAAGFDDVDEHELTFVVAQRFEVHAEDRARPVVHGLLVGVVAVLTYELMTIRLQVPVTWSYVVIHALKLVGGSAGGWVAAQRSHAPGATMT